MSDLTRMTVEQRRQILEDYLDAVFGDHPDAVAEKLQMGAPEIPDEPTSDQAAAWVELTQLLRDPDYIAASRRMAERARTESPQRDVANIVVGKAVVEHAGPAARAGVDPGSAEALAVVERVGAVTPNAAEDRSIVADRIVADRIVAFTDRRVARYWTLVGIINGWPPSPGPGPDELVDSWESYGRALRAHASHGS